ncbi:MAG: Fic family protein [Acidobacteria bacterium]|nr:Fic family protein [Acidobacteriota bacterium]
MALIKGAQATTAIEGNTLTDEEVRQVADGDSLPPSKGYQEREVRNVIDAMNGILTDVVERALLPPVSPQLMLSFHQRIGSELGEHFDAIPGQFRTDERVVGPYKCPRGSDVRRVVDLFCEWRQEEFASSEGSLAFADAVIQAIVTHVYVEWIHPFGDGNGRTGRLLEFYLLLRAGNPDIGSHILSNFYNETRSAYYRQLHQANKRRDLSEFIAYAVEGYRDGLLDTLKTIQKIQFRIAWQSLVHERFAKQGYRKKRVFKRRRELMLQFPLDRTVSLERLPMRSIDLARKYSALTSTTLLRDVRFLIDMDLVVADASARGYRANTDLLRRQMPARRARTQKTG